jgi:hypothetical protein
VLYTVQFASNGCPVVWYVRLVDWYGTDVYGAVDCMVLYRRVYSTAWGLHGIVWWVAWYVRWVAWYGAVSCMVWCGGRTAAAALLGLFLWKG